MANSAGSRRLQLRGNQLENRFEESTVLNDEEFDSEICNLTLECISGTVLITDDFGTLTFVSSNVEVIFSASQREVYRLGTIDKVLGNDVCDHQRLADEGELRNIEHDIEDRQGRVRHLVIDIKAVDVGGGTALYCCRDATEMKRAGDELVRERNHLRELVTERTAELEEAERQLQRISHELGTKQDELDRKDAALRELLSQIEKGRDEARTNIRTNVVRLIQPLARMVESKLPASDRHLVALLDSAVNSLLDPSVGPLERTYTSLSAREMEVANMVRNGFSSKQIASVLSVSMNTVNNQRRSIRKKLGIDDNKTNLTTFLKSL